MGPFGGSKGGCGSPPSWCGWPTTPMSGPSPYDRVLEDLFSVQSEVASSVAGALDLTLGAGERGGLQRVPTRDMEAYDRYLRAWRRSGRVPSGNRSRPYLAYYRPPWDRDPSFVEARAAWRGPRLPLLDALRPIRGAAERPGPSGTGGGARSRCGRGPLGAGGVRLHRPARLRPGSQGIGSRPNSSPEIP